MKARIGAAIAAAFGIAAAGVAAAPAASAAGQGTCPGDFVCVSDGPNLSGQQFNFQALQLNPGGFDDPCTLINVVDLPHLSKFKFPGGKSLNDSIRSVFNNTDIRVDFFPDANFTGAGFQLAPHSRLGTLDNVDGKGRNVVDKLSSIRRSPGEKGC